MTDSVKMLEGVNRVVKRINQICKRFEWGYNFRTRFDQAQKSKSVPAVYQKKLMEVAAKYRLPVKLLTAIAQVESGFDPFAVSPKGAIGIMQLMPSTAKLVGVKEPLNPLENIEGGAKYLRMLLDKYSGDLVLALAAYNAGPEVVDKYGGVPPFEETISYIEKILKLLRGRDYAP